MLRTLWYVCKKIRFFKNKRALFAIVFPIKKRFNVMRKTRIEAETVNIV